MKVRWLGLNLAAALVACASSHAAIIIPTNQSGADTEVRPEEISVDPIFGNVNATQQRGASTELATRGNDTGVTTSAGSEHASVMYMKFDISTLPNHTSNPGFWSDKNVYWRGTVRNTNISDGRAGFPQPPVSLPTTFATFTMRGLEPSVGRYIDDNPAQANRTDRSSLAYTSSQYKYDWSEGTGTGSGGAGIATGINGLDAPGMTPFCTVAGACNTSTYGGTADNPFQGLGKFDDFNSDARNLGDFKLAQPRNLFPAPANRYPIGYPIEVQSANLKQLIFDAQDAGRTKITVMINFGLNTSSTQPYTQMLNFNYLINPKEQLTTSNDANWYDPDGAGPLPPFGSPYSCDGTTSPGTTNCPGNPALANNNASGKFSPSLIIRVPEPATITLGVISLLGMLGMIRRRRG